MNRSDLDRLHDARAYAVSAKSLAGPSAVSIDQDKDRLHALLFRLIVVGEALGRTTKSILALEADTPWRDVIDTRNRLIHAYWQIDLAVVVDLVEHDLDPLVAAIDRLLTTIGKRS